MVNTVKCGNCGAAQSSDPHDHSPCPECGSTIRNFSIVPEPVHISVTGREAILNATLDSLTLESTGTISTNISLLRQTVVMGTVKTSEGQLIETVALPWFEIIKILKSDPTAAYRISPRVWEEIVAGAYKKAGFDEVTLTPRSGDFGRDVIATKYGIGKIRVIDQVKAYKPDHLVTADDVRTLVGVLHGDGASKGFLTTTSDFAPKLRVDPLIAPFIPSRLDLVNGSMLITRLTELAKKRSI